jgi:hypothetical protein
MLGWFFVMSEASLGFEVDLSRKDLKTEPAEEAEMSQILKERGGVT